MKQIKEMSQAELAAFIQATLQNQGIGVVLSGVVLFHFTVETNTFPRTWIESI